ncbi:MAG: TonB-dependent receptor [Sphingomicrobium sp.]
MLDIPNSVPLPTSDTIVVTASRVPSTPATTAASVSLVDEAELVHLGSPLVSDYLRLLPSVAVAMSGPAGSQTDVRIRGAEANHTLLFIDGIRANDPAAGNAPRFELLNADLVSRIEVVRGPQSALWGSEAIGGVVSVGSDPAAASGASLMAEAGSFATYRGSASGSYVGKGVTAAFGIAGQKSRGTNAFNGPGDRDGYDNASLRGRLAWAVAPKIAVGLSGFATSELSQYDGYSSGGHADTLDNTRNKLGAVRSWVSIGGIDDALSATVSASILDSSNVNRLDRTELNRTSADRRTLVGELRHHSTIGALDQHIVVAIEQEDENFHTRGYSSQDHDRRHRSATLEWKGDWQALTGDVAVRRDSFNRFRDATTLRASLLARLGAGVEVTGSYGEGIAQPTFFDLYGYDPTSFTGNPTLAPERSRGFEASIRWHDSHWSAALTGYRQRLHGEILTIFAPPAYAQTTINAAGTSRREGGEVELGWKPSPALRIHAQGAYLRATEPDNLGLQIREVRRPKWSGALVADGAQGRFNYAASLAFTGARSDVDFDQFDPTTSSYKVVRLGGYVLASARIGYQVAPGIEFFGRVANAFDRDYRDVVGYRPSGRSVSGGIRLAVGR